MKLKFVNRVGIVVTHITSNLHRIRDIDILDLPFCSLLPFFDVVHLLKSLQMLISFAVELKVGLEVGLVLTKFANIRASHCHKDFIFSDAGPILLHMLTQCFNAITRKDSADATVKYVTRVVVRDGIQSK